MSAYAARRTAPLARRFCTDAGVASESSFFPRPRLRFVPLASVVPDDVDSAADVVASLPPW